jgi:hypothetical protein
LSVYSSKNIFFFRMLEDYFINFLNSNLNKEQEIKFDEIDVVKEHFIKFYKNVFHGISLDSSKFLEIIKKGMENNIIFDKTLENVVANYGNNSNLNNLSYEDMEYIFDNGKKNFFFFNF